MIYTAVIGSRDPLRADVRCIRQLPSVGLWSERMQARMCKVLSHLFFNTPTIWVDANVVLRLSEKEAFDKYLKDADFATFAHPIRTTIREECRAVNALGFASDDLEADFGQRLDAGPLFGTSVVLRSNRPAVRRLNEIWWSLICRYSVRDQLTLSLALDLVPEIKVAIIPQYADTNSDFVFTNHGMATP